MIKQLKNAWKEITLLSAWIASVAGSFVIPLPAWAGSSNISSFYLKFIIFFATIVAGFLVLYTYRNKNLKLWFKLSILFFALLTLSIVGYYYSRATKTLPYSSIEVIIGNDRIENDPLTDLEEKGNLPLEREEIMRHFQGESERVWTRKSINTNKIILIGLLALSYTLTSCFIISFCNLIVLHKEKYNEESLDKDVENIAEVVRDNEEE